MSTGFAAARISGWSWWMRLSEVALGLASTVCSMFASCVRANSRSHRRRIDSCMIMGPTERTCSVSTWMKRSEALCSAEPSWFEMIAEECTMSSNTVVHHASRSSSRTAFTGTWRSCRSAMSSPKPAASSSRSRLQRSGSVSSALRSSNSALRRSSTTLKSAVCRSPPSGVVASTVSSAVMLLSSASCVATMSSSFGGSTGQPPCGTNRRHCWACFSTTTSASCRSSTCAPTRSMLFASLIWRRRSQKPMDWPSDLRSDLGVVASIIASMSRSKISGWNTSSTRRRFLSTVTCLVHSCAVVGIEKPHVFTVDSTCSRVAGSRLRSMSTTRW